MNVDTQELAELIQGMINNALVQGGFIQPAAEVQAPAPVVLPTPEYLVTINGEVVSATIADEDELYDLIQSVKGANSEAKINVYILDGTNVDVEDYE